MPEIEVQTFSIDKLQEILNGFLDMFISMREVQQLQQKQIELITAELKQLREESCRKNQ